MKNSATVDSSLTANLLISNALQTLGLAQIDALLVNNNITTTTINAVKYFHNGTEVDLLGVKAAVDAL